MSDEKLIRMYRETKNQDYFNVLYKRYTALKNKYSKINNSEYESNFNLIFTLAVNKFKLENANLFRTYLIKALNNKFYSMNTYNQRHTAKDISIESIVCSLNLKNVSSGDDSIIFSEEVDYEDLIVTHIIEEKLPMFINDFVNLYSTNTYRDRTKKVLEMMIIERKTNKEISQIIGVSNQALCVTKNRFKKYFTCR